MVPVGEGVFETLKVVDNRPHALTRHLIRMGASAASIGMVSLDTSDARIRVEGYLAGRPLELGRLRIAWLTTADGAELSLAAEPMSEYPGSATLTFDDWAVDEHGPLAGIKSTRYENFAGARQRAMDAGFDDALLTNRAGNVCETSTANLFYVLNGQLITPLLASGCLPGIARGIVLDLCDVVEADAPLSVLDEATEVFMTSSLRGVQPVRRIGEQTYPEMGPAAAEAADAWQRLVRNTWDPAPAMPEDENSRAVR